MMDEKRDIGATNIDGTPSSFKNGSPIGTKAYERGIVDQQAAEPEPTLSDQSEQGIAQTGEEDPLSVVEDHEVSAAVRELTHNQKSGSVQTEATNPRQHCDNSPIASSKTATASFDSGSAPIGATDGQSVLAWGKNNSPPLDAIAPLRSLVAALSDSVKAYEYAAREGVEFFRPIFLDRSKERKEMVNEFNARILAIGAVPESESDYIPGFESSMRQANASDGNMINLVEEFEANLRALFLTAIDAHRGETEDFLSTQYLVIQRSEEELRHVRAELNPKLF